VRAIVTGSRTWKEPVPVFAALDILTDSGDLTVVHGDCPEGADRWAKIWCSKQVYLSKCRVKEEPYPANWATYGNRAGFIRNQEMVNLGADVVLAFSDWCTKLTCPWYKRHMSHGTENCVQAARNAGIEVVEFGVTISETHLRLDREAGNV
jgi:hypothetical protein